jgi:hypothetical protein
VVILKRGNSNLGIFGVCASAILLSLIMSEGKIISCPDPAESVESASILQYSVFSKWRKRYIVGLVALAAWFSTLSSFIYYPSIPLIAQDLHLSIAQINLSITTYMAVSAVAPSITGDASDIYGRRPLYLLTLSMYLLANIGLAIQSSFTGLLLVRMLQSAGISGMVLKSNRIKCL